MCHSFLAYLVSITCAARSGRDVDARARVQYSFRTVQTAMHSASFLFLYHFLLV